jgi:hypothetical protein
MTVNQRLQAVRAAAAASLPDALMAAGAAAISGGAWMVYQPAGWIAAGAFSLVAGVLMARGAK